MKNLGTTFRAAAGVLAKKKISHVGRSTRLQNLVMKCTECLIIQCTNALRYLKVNITLYIKICSIINLHSNVLEVITTMRISGRCGVPSQNRIGFRSFPFKKLCQEPLSNTDLMGDFCC